MPQNTGIRAVRIGKACAQANREAVRSWWEAALASADEMLQRSLQRRILAYLMDHPGAKDTGEGIRGWWLQDASDVKYSTLQEALDDLAKRGWLELRGTTGDDRMFSLNPNEARAIAHFLEEG